MDSAMDQAIMGTTMSTEISTAPTGDRRLAMTPEPLRSFLLRERMWTRKLRIQHAEHQLSAASPADKQFWRDVLNANSAGED
jgi:hypothetical protein